MEEVDDELDDSVQQGCMLKAQDIEPLLKCGYLKAAVTLTDWERIKYWVVVTHNCDLVKSPVKDALVELFPCHEDKGEEPFSHNLNFGGNVLTGSPAIADRLRRCPQP